MQLSLHVTKLSALAGCGAVGSTGHRHLSARRVGQSRSENFNTLLSNQQGVLELRSPAAIGSHTRPVVWPSPVLVRTQSNHRLDGETHARLRLTDSLVLRVMGHVGRAMEELVDTVAAVSLDDTAVCSLRYLLDRVAVVSEEGTRLDELDRLLKAVSCGLDDAHTVGVLVGFANVVGLVQVTVEAAVVKRDVDIEDVAVLERALIGDTVADNFVGGCADRFGEVAVVERRRV